MKLLTITNMWPTLDQPYYGIFVKEQLENIENKLNVKSDLYFIDGKNKGKLAYLKSIFALYNIIKKGKYDIIHIHYGLSGLFLLFYKPKSKIFMTLHGGDIQKEQGKKIQIFLAKKILKKVNKVFVLNDNMVKVVSSIGINYEILPCGVNQTFFNSSGKIEILSNSKLILFPGDSERKVKNYPLFEETLNLLNERAFYTYKYECIHNLSRKEVRDLMLRADCLLMTSISEGSPQVVKEALSCGLRVISVPVGDVNQIIDNIKACYISKNHDAKELALLVEASLKEDSSKIREQFLVKGTYDNESICNRIIKNYMQ